MNHAISAAYTLKRGSVFSSIKRYYKPAARGPWKMCRWNVILRTIEDTIAWNITRAVSHQLISLLVESNASMEANGIHRIPVLRVRRHLGRKDKVLRIQRLVDDTSLPTQRPRPSNEQKLISKVINGIRSDE